MLQNTYNEIIHSIIRSFVHLAVTTHCGQVQTELQKLKHLRSASVAVYKGIILFIMRERNDMSCFPFVDNDNLLNQINPYTNYLCTIWSLWYADLFLYDISLDVRSCKIDLFVLFDFNLRQNYFPWLQATLDQQDLLIDKMVIRF